MMLIIFNKIVLKLVFISMFCVFKGFFYLVYYYFENKMFFLSGVFNFRNDNMYGDV